MGIVIPTPYFYDHVKTATVCIFGILLSKFSVANAVHCFRCSGLNIISLRLCYFNEKRDFSLFCLKMYQKQDNKNHRSRRVSMHNRLQHFCRVMKITISTKKYRLKSMLLLKKKKLN